jgi:hypothetical protein
MRRCLLKGCEQRFHPLQARQRYCSERCRDAARKWDRWKAQQRYRETAAGKQKRNGQSRRYRERVKSRKPSVPEDELKTHLRGAQIVLRSKTTELVRQEFFGLLMAHFAIRGLMHEAALQADEDPDRISFVHSVHVVQRRMARYGAIPPSAEKSVTRSDPR